MDEDYDQINQSRADKSTQQAQKKKRCMIISIIIGVIVVAALVVVLVVVLKGSSSIDGDNFYEVVEATQTPWSYQAVISTDEKGEYPVAAGPNNEILRHFKFDMGAHSDNTFTFNLHQVNLKESVDENGNKTITTEDVKRWEYGDDLLQPGASAPDFSQRISWASFEAFEKPFGFKLSHPQSKQMFLSTKETTLIMMDKYMEMGFHVPTQDLYGFGERIHEFKLKEGMYTAYTKGQDSPIDKGVPGNNVYGDHPFLLARLPDKTYIGIFLKNSNAKQLQIRYVDETDSVVTFITTGGVLDFRFFFAHTAGEVIKAYHNVIGKPYMPPFWSLGFQQGSWTYETQDKLQEVVDGYTNAGFPFDVVWADIEYMDRYRDFTVDEKRFPTFGQFADNLHKDNMKLAMIVDPGITAEDDYSYYTEGTKDEVFIKSAINKDVFKGNLIGSVWPAQCAFPDFFHPKTQQFWSGGLNDLHKKVSYDGIWIDMNELTNLCVGGGECPGNPRPGAQGKVDVKAMNQSAKRTERKLLSADENDYYNIPFNPQGEVALDDMGISMNATYYGETEQEKKERIEWNVHGLYATMQARSTFEFATQFEGYANRDKRPFILTRSSMAGTGKWASHWLGDNYSRWEYMKLSIAGSMNMNMFGIPVVGADICGFFEKWDEEMCARWMQVGAFQPFYRNHYNKTNVVSQESYLLKDDHLTAAKSAVFQRYSFLRYMYTKLYHIHRDGGMLMQPEFFEFNDDKLLTHADSSWMVGDALKVTPALEKGQTQIDTYFPVGADFVDLNDPTKKAHKGGETVKMPATWTHVPVYQRSGTIIPWQDSKDVKTTTDLLSRGIKLFIHPNEEGSAKGTVYTDANGDSKKDFDEWNLGLYNIKYGERAIKFMKEDGSGGDDTWANNRIDEISIFNVPDLDGADSVCILDNSMSGTTEAKVNYDKDNKILTITNSGNNLWLHKLQTIQIIDSSKDANLCGHVYKLSEISVQNKLTATVNPSDSNYEQLKFEFYLAKGNVLNMRIAPSSGEARFEAPFVIDEEARKPEESPYNIESILKFPPKLDQFWFEVHEPDNPSNVYYSTRGRDFVFMDRYIKLQANIQSNQRMFGLGERVGDFFLKEGVYSIWTRDIASPVEDGQRPGKNEYGAHPVYYAQNDNGDWMVVANTNHNAQDFELKFEDRGVTVTQTTTGGILDLWMIFPKPLAEATHDFVRLVGRPTMVPEWSLGWHQCRWGYNSTEDLRAVVKGYDEHKLPIDTMWSDIDYMDVYRDFTWDKEGKFKGLDKLIDELHSEHRHWIPIIDGGIAVGDYDIYNQGIEQGVYIRSSVDEKLPTVGKVWPGPAVYVDWWHPKATEQWIKWMTDFRKELNFDGLWLDMNECSNFCNGVCKPEHFPKKSVQDKLLYQPSYRDLNWKSIEVDAKHHGGILEMDAHSLYGSLMSKATHEMFQKNNERTFIISRSTSMGFGKFGSHWLGDNFASWDMMRYSIVGVYQFGHFGVPVSGSDICGFIGDTTKELCTRWTQLGAFYPFSRNHNLLESKPQEPYVFNEKITGLDITYTQVMGEAIRYRYAILRYLYTELHKASKDGTPVFRQLFFDFPDDAQSFVDIEKNILIGKVLKVSPILEEGMTSDSFYFPNVGSGRWCRLYHIEGQNSCITSGRQTLNTPIQHLNLHVSPETILPYQDVVKSEIRHLHDLKQTKMSFAVNPAGTNYEAWGELIMDDGKTQNLDEINLYKLYAKGVSPLIGAGKLDFTITQEKAESKRETTPDEHFGHLKLLRASYFKMTTTSKAHIMTKLQAKIDLDVTFDGSADMMIATAPEKIKLSEIALVHFDSQ